MIRIEGIPGQSKTLLEQLLNQFPPTDQEVLVSWGNSGPHYHLNGQPRVDGLQQLIRFSGAGLLVPEFTTDLNLAKWWVQEGYLVFGRNLIHTQGRDIVGPGRFSHRGRFFRPWLRREFWVKVIPNVLEEWRIHVFKNKSIARGLKYAMEPPTRRMPVRNRANGWFIRHDVEPPKGIRQVAKSAVDQCGYSFGAVDLLVTEKFNDVATKVYVLEVNKAPGLDNYTASAYATAIRGFADTL